MPCRTPVWVRGLKYSTIVTNYDIMIVENLIRKEHIVITLENFGHKKLNGLQHKGIVTIDGVDQFVKLDELNPAISGEWENKFDYKYSSVSESIAACVTRNLVSTHRHADYTFEVFEHKGQPVSGTRSDVFLKDNEVERVLSIGSNGAIESNVAISIEEYAETVVDKPQKERLDTLVRLLSNNKVPENTARQFLLEQASVDILLGNMDRLNNPSNFVVAYDVTTDTATPVNMDYGRCLQIPDWSDTFEANYDTSNAEYVDEDRQDFADNVLRANEAIINGYNLDTSLDVLREFGAEPLRVNVSAAIDDIEHLQEQFRGLPFEKFAYMKCETTKEVLKIAQEKGMVIDTATELTNDDLKIETETEERMTIKFDENNMTFLISGEPIMSFTIKDEKMSHVEVYNEFAAEIVLPEEKRNYSGLERQLQHYMDTKDDLPHMIETIKKDGFTTPIHYNLDLEIEQAMAQ